METEPKLSFLAIYSNNSTNTVRLAIIIATTIAKVSPYQTVTLRHKASQPFCVDLKKENVYSLQCKLCSLHISMKQPVVCKPEIFFITMYSIIATNFCIYKARGGNNSPIKDIENFLIIISNIPLGGVVFLVKIK